MRIVALRIQVDILEKDIIIQDVSMAELVSKHFVAKEMGLSDDEYWEGYQGFKTCLEVAQPILAGHPVL